ncbi:MAG TPA: DUF3606 domain-containing protein [Caulobacteraceae bacterium]|nr:DUF3606 domain-containing protein [Caulobacteraceae bacterium]
MYDNRTVVKLEPKRIDIAVEYELQYWARALCVSRDALIAAVDAVGDDARAVSRQLGKG